jgi:Ca2+ transporting ATPase
MADNALRTICVAYKDLSGSENLDSKDRLGVYDVETSGLTMVAILGIADIVRPEVPLAVKVCFEAGIKVRMVTGDNKDTARAIAA